MEYEERKIALGYILNPWRGPTTLFPLAHFWSSLSLSRSGGPSCVLSEKEDFVCFVNGLMEQRDRIVALSLEGKGYSFLKSPGSFGKISGFLTQEFSFDDSLG